jgi:hypothetical protein
MLSFPFPGVNSRVELVPSPALRSVGSGMNTGKMNSVSPAMNTGKEPLIKVPTIIEIIFNF